MHLHRYCLISWKTITLSVLWAIHISITCTVCCAKPFSIRISLCTSLFINYSKQYISIFCLSNCQIKFDLFFIRNHLFHHQLSPSIILFSIYNYILRDSKFPEKRTLWVVNRKVLHFDKLLFIILSYLIDFLLKSFLHLFFYSFDLQIYPITFLYRSTFFELKDNLLLEDWFSGRIHHINHNFNYSMLSNTIKTILLNNFFSDFIIFMFLYFVIDLLLLCHLVCKVHSIWEDIEEFNINGWILFSVEVIKIKNLFIDEAVF